jgi:tol-pal system protein YbgF
VFRISLSVLAFACLPWLTGCGENGLLVKRIDILEQDLNDLHQSNREIEKRLDEMQIRLQLITKRLSADKGLSSKSVYEARGKTSEVKTVKLSSGKRGRLQAGRSFRAKGIRGSARKSRHRGTIEPGDISERLPVDKSSASMPLLGGISVEPGQDDMGAMEEGFDEESIERDFTKAISPFRSSHYVRAIETLTKFAADYAGHPLVIDALYYLGRAHLERGEYHKAHVDFSAVSRQDPKNKLAADALLLSARCQEKLGRPRDARTIYLQLVQAFPLSEEAAQANQRLRYIR